MCKFNIILHDFPHASPSCAISRDSMFDNSQPCEDKHCKLNNLVLPSVSTFYVFAYHICILSFND